MFEIVKIQILFQKMDDQPIEIYHLIFEYLDIIDLTNCKLVNKKFYKYVKEFRIKELIFYSSKSCWFYINKPFNCNYRLVHFKISPFLKKSTFNFKFLKYLNIEFVDEMFNLTEINKFDKLKVLEIYLTNYQNKADNKLALNNLEVLRIDSSKFIQIEIDCPKLRSLHYWSFNNKLIIKHPLKIHFLTTYKYGSDLLKFSNLEYLNLNSTANLEQFNFEQLSKLKELKIKSDDSKHVSNLILKKVIKNPNLIVYFNGFHVINSNQLIFDRYDLALQLKNYEKLIGVLDWMNLIEYNKLIDLIQNELPINFHQKYSNIQRINVINKVKNSKHLIQFIGHSQMLTSLSTINSKLDQQFYNELPSISSLNFLTLEEDCEIGLKFDFILKMFCLKCLNTNQKVTFDSTIELDQLKYLNKSVLNR